MSKKTTTPEPTLADKSRGTQRGFSLFFVALAGVVFVAGGLQILPIIIGIALTGIAYVAWFHPASITPTKAPDNTVPTGEEYFEREVMTSPTRRSLHGYD